MPYFLIKTNPKGELEVHYNPENEPKQLPSENDDDYNYAVGKWQSKTIIVPFASIMEAENTMMFLYEKWYQNNNGYDSVNQWAEQGIEVDCIEVRDNKAYFKERVKNELESNTFNNKDLLLNGFGNWCLLNSVRFNDSNQISEKVTEFLNSDYYKNIKNTQTNE